MKIGSQAHKELFCQSFIESHLVYEPESLPWPLLDELALEHLRSIPFWEEAFTLEQNAGVMVNAYAQKVSDPLIREAIALQGSEETRHAHLIQFMLNHYGINIPQKLFPQPPEKLNQAFLDFGYSECLDSFLAFGLFKIARLSGIFPEPLFTIFDPILDEEARHIVFFVNWVAYEQVQQSRGANLFRATHSLWYYGRALQNLIKMVTKADNKGEGFTATGASAFVNDLSPHLFLSACLAENTRRMSRFDKRLLHPQFLPIIAQAVQGIFQLLPQRTSDSEAEISLSPLKKL